jgi:hypothetical protein
MNDEFMHEFYEAPRPEFGNALYERISKKPPSRFAQIFLSHPTFRYAVIAFVSLFIIAAGIYVAYQSRWNKVGGIWVDVQQTLTLEWGPSDLERVKQEPAKCLRVEEAREILRFDFQMPTWAPDGFTFDNRICGIDQTSDFAGLYWKGADQYSGISIMLHNLRWFNMASQEYEVGPASTMLPVAPGSYEEVHVHGRPAILVHGDWEYPWMTEDAVPEVPGKRELKWDERRGLQLYWVEGEVLYHLNTWADVSAEDLIKMAESAR